MKLPAMKDRTCRLQRACNDKIAALVLALLFVLAASAFIPQNLAFAAESRTVVIGSDTETNYRSGPYGDTAFQFSFAEMLYTADEIGTEGSDAVISEISFSVAQAKPFTPTKVQVYLANTDATSVDIDLISFIDPNDFTKVYEGTPDLGKQTGWETLTFSSTFTYKGGKNLAVIILRQGIDAPTTGSSDATLYAATTSSGQLAMRYSQLPSVGYYEDLASAIKSDPQVYYASPADATLRPNIQITLSDAPTEPVFKVSESPYAGNQYLVTYTAQVPDGQAPSMNCACMFKLGDTYVALASKDQAAALTNASFECKAQTATIITRDGDVNGNGKINIMDAQIAFDLSNNVYADFSKLDMQRWLRADVNGDGCVSALDARKIQATIHDAAK